jgi:drug/metabolite transporter (DMT)-like permease
MIFGRLSGRVSPLAMNVTKCAFAGTMLLLTRIALGGPDLAAVPMQAWAALAFSAVVGVAIGDSAYFGAMAALGVPRAILLLSSAPLFAALGGVLFLGEHLDARTALGIVVTLSGLGLVIIRREKRAASITLRGVTLGLVAALSQGAGSVLSKGAMQSGIDPLAAATGRLLMAVVALVLLGIVTKQVATWKTELLTDRAALKISAASMLGTYLGIWLAQIAIQHASSTGVATTLLAISPLFALPIAHVTGIERASLKSVVGALIALTGVAVLTLR